MKRVRKKSYLFLGLPVLILSIIAVTIILLGFKQGTIPENNKVIMIVIACISGAAGIAGLIGIILFFTKTYEVKEK